MSYKATHRELLDRIQSELDLVKEEIDKSKLEQKFEEIKVIMRLFRLDKYLPIEGNRYGRLTVLDRHDSPSGRSLWNCLCSCGKDRVADQNDLIHSRLLSCGCARGSGNGGEKSHFSKLTKEKVLEIREKFSEGKTIRRLSIQYGVTYANVFMIVKRRTWKHI